MPQRLVVLFVLCSIAEAEDGVGAEYIGGTVAAIAGKASGRLRTNDNVFLDFQAKGQEIHVTYDKINLVEYGQNVDRRYLLAVLVSPLFLLRICLEITYPHKNVLGYTGSSGRSRWYHRAL